MDQVTCSVIVSSQLMEEKKDKDNVQLTWRDLN